MLVLAFPGLRSSRLRWRAARRGFYDPLFSLALKNGEENERARLALCEPVALKSRAFSWRDRAQGDFVAFFYSGVRKRVCLARWFAAWSGSRFGLRLNIADRDEQPITFRGQGTVNGRGYANLSSHAIDRLSRTDLDGSAVIRCRD